MNIPDPEFRHALSQPYENVEPQMYRCEHCDQDHLVRASCDEDGCGSATFELIPMLDGTLVLLCENNHMSGVVSTHIHRESLS